MINGNGHRSFFWNHKFTLKSFNFFLSNLSSITLSFSGNSLLSLINSVWFDIRLSCSFIAKSINFLLVIFCNCFLVGMLLTCHLVILLTISHSALVEETSYLYESAMGNIWIKAFSCLFFLFLFLKYFANSFVGLLSINLLKRLRALLKLSFRLLILFSFIGTNLVWITKLCILWRVSTNFLFESFC